MAYFFIYLLIIIVNIFAVLFVLKIRRNRLNDADVITDATLVEAVSYTHLTLPTSPKV